MLLTFEAQYRYANGVRLIYKTDQPYVRFEGTEGWVEASYEGVKAAPSSVIDYKIGPAWKRLPFKTDKQDFIDAVKTRGQTLEDAEVGHRTTSLCHLAHIAIQVGGRLEWDPDKERFTNSEAANGFIGKAIHAPRVS